MLSDHSIYQDKGERKMTAEKEYGHIIHLMAMVDMRIQEAVLIFRQRI
jgi:hypothetical protein